MNRLADRVAVVTGGAGGIGAAICRAFAAEGALVAVADARLQEAEKVAQGLQNGHALAFDVSDGPSVEAAADEVEARLGPIDIWVNNAGVSYVTGFLECSEETWDETIRVNLRGTFIGCRAALRRMRPRRRGVVLNMSSQSGKVGNSHYAAYCASKFGVIGLTQSLALEFAHENIRVNAICPGVVFTRMWDGMLDGYARKRGIPANEVRSYLESKIPLGRLCLPEDVANVAVFLASDEAAYMTGQSVNVSGGTVMG